MDDENLVDLIQKEGLHRGGRRGEIPGHAQGAPPDPGIGPDPNLFQTFQRDGGRQATRPARRGTARSATRTPSPTTTATAWPTSTSTRPSRMRWSRQGGGYPIRLKMDDYVVHEVEHQTRCATVVLIDMSGSMSRYGKYATTKKVALALQAMVRGQYSPGHACKWSASTRIASVMTERAALELRPQAGEHLRQPGQPPLRPRQPAQAGPAALHQHRRRPSPGPEHPGQDRRPQQADHRHHRRRAHRPHRRARGRPDLSALREDRPAHPGTRPAAARPRESGCRASP